MKQKWIHLCNRLDYQFKNTDILRQVKRTSLEQMLKFQPSSRSLLIERVVSGHYWTMMQLGVNAAFRPNLEKALAISPKR